MTLRDFVSTIDGLADLKHVEKIKLFAWYIHSHRGLTRFGVPDIAACYEELALEPPGNIHRDVARLESKSPREFLRDAKGYALELRVRSEFDAKYGLRPSAIAIDNLLAELPARLPAVEERIFLDETIKCFRAGAFRATIVMAWNLAFHHLCAFVLLGQRDAFNAHWPLRYPKEHAKARVSRVEKYDDFAELKESQVIQICKSAAIISADVARILEEKLGKRNTAAHPSMVELTRIEAEAFINELVRNVVLRLVLSEAPIAPSAASC